MQRSTRNGGHTVVVTLTGVLRRLGPLGRKIAWNREFRMGAEFVGARATTMVELVKRYGENRSVVELACGDGSLSRSLSAVPFKSYLGYDLSDEAIRKASADANPNRRFLTGQMQDWRPTGAFDLLIVEEAIYYLSSGQQKRLLGAAFAFSPQATAIISVHSRTKHEKSLETCRECAQVVDEIVEGERAYLVLKAPAGQSLPRR